MPGIRGGFPGLGCSCAPIFSKTWEKLRDAETFAPSRNDHCQARFDDVTGPPKDIKGGGGKVPKRYFFVFETVP